MSILKTDLDGIGNILTKAIKDEMYDMMKAKLQKEADAIISELARELTDKVAAAVETYQAPGGFGPQTLVALSFNAKDTTYRATRD